MRMEAPVQQKYPICLVFIVFGPTFENQKPLVLGYIDQNGTGDVTSKET